MVSRSKIDLRLVIPLLVALVGCAGQPTGDIGSGDKQYPESWPPPLSWEGGTQGCPSIDATYFSKGQSNSDISERFSIPIFEQIFLNLTDVADETNVFEVVHASENKKVYFDIFGPEDESLSTGHYKRYEKCEKGWIVYESASKGGSGDSPVKSTRSITRMGLAEDGSLVIHSHYEAVWRKYVFGSETRVSDIWYRFERAK